MFCSNLWLIAVNYLTAETEVIQLDSKCQTFAIVPSLTLPPRAVKSFMHILTFTKDISVAEQKVSMWIEFVS